jgi:hypothetical protein
MEIAILPKPIYRFNTIPIKPPMLLFTETEKSILKFTWREVWPGLIAKIYRNHNLLLE